MGLGEKAGLLCRDYVCLNMFWECSSAQDGGQMMGLLYTHGVHVSAVEGYTGRDGGNESLLRNKRSCGI